MKFWCTGIVFLLSVVSGIGQASFRSDETVDHLPAVFQLGDYEGLYSDLVANDYQLLLGVCENDLNQAFLKWYDLLTKMQYHGQKLDIDLRGAKIWVNVFFNRDGSIKHLAYHLKPKSRNIDSNVLDAFFASFVRQYKINIQSDRPFYHSGHAAFPVTIHP